MARRPKMPSTIRLAIYERDGYACRHCGWSVSKPEGYRGHHPIGVVVGTRKRLTYFRPSFTDKPDVRIYVDEDVRRYLEIDHITPLILGGAFKDPANLQALCSPCNNRKGVRV